LSNPFNSCQGETYINTCWATSKTKSQTSMEYGRDARDTEKLIGNSNIKLAPFSYTGLLTIRSCYTNLFPFCSCYLSWGTAPSNSKMSCIDGFGTISCCKCQKYALSFHIQCHHPTQRIHQKCEWFNNGYLFNQCYSVWS